MFDLIDQQSALTIASAINEEAKGATLLYSPGILGQSLLKSLKALETPTPRSGAHCSYTPISRNSNKTLKSYYEANYKICISIQNLACQEADYEKKLRN